MSAASSQVQIHSTHIVLFAVWVVVFTAVYLHKRARTTDSETTSRSQANPSTLRARIVGLPGAIALCSVIAAGVHLSVIDDHFHEALLYGTFFLLLTAGQFAFAGWTLWRPTRALFKAGAAASLAIVLLWLATRTTGIPLGPAAGETEPVGRLDVTASVAELATTLLCIAALRASHLSTTTRRGGRREPKLQTDAGTWQGGALPNPTPPPAARVPQQHS